MTIADHPTRLAAWANWHLPPHSTHIPSLPLLGSVLPRNRLVAAHEVDQTVDTLRATIEQQVQTIGELNASNQQLAQTIKDMDAGYQRNIARFTKIREMTQTILFHARLSLIDEDRVASIKTWALEGEKEEGDNA